MNNDYLMYTTDYISGTMSLRKPQEKSLKILENILNHVMPSKNMDINLALEEVKKLYPICTDFERDFMSLAFVLATGVGKTRLMGAFISYLYTNHGIKNFFVVAPGKVIYNKLKKDLGDPGNPKYVFKGLGCFNNPPRIIADDDYRDRNISFFESDVNIYIFNIGKFDSENTKMRAINEYLGDSFFDYLSKLDDLVLIMDESHHYHAAQGFLALNDLKPILGLELTATPYYNKGSRQIPFRNAVYEYPLSESIKDGYTRTPYAVTRQDISFYNFGVEEIDKTMLADGLLCHENMKEELLAYSENTGERLVKPFVMVVCKDTEHATKIYDYVISPAFLNGKYSSKTLLIHSKKRGSREADIDLLTGVEDVNNPIEIVIHVDMLKEGWDVNNLYTIIPLRTAASKILREQMVGRGLRLPYGARTGVKEVDSVYLTAHDKFDELLKEAQSGDSIFKAGNFIKAEEIIPKKTKTTQISLNISEKELIDDLEELGLEETETNIKTIQKTKNIIHSKISARLTSATNNKPKKGEIEREIMEEIKKDEDLAKTYENSVFPYHLWIQEKTEETITKTHGKFIPIPLIKVTDEGKEEYKFIDFDIDLSDFTHVPISNDLLIQNLENMNDRTSIKGQYIDFDGYNPEKILLEMLKNKAEIDYEECSELLFKLIEQVISHYDEKYGQNGMKNIIMMNKRDIAGKIYEQMLKEEHFYYSNGLLQEEVVDLARENIATSYNYTVEKKLFEEPEGVISDNLFGGIIKGVFQEAKFDSKPELIFARVIETDQDVLNWLRPNSQQFKIYYNRNRRYEPDFVVETDDAVYLVEVKGEDKLNDPDVLAKKERAMKYCEISTEWGKVNGYKEWKYLFIPAGQINMSSSFTNLAARFEGV
ncbi:MAG: DEAD/DEAH box helicase family protein [Erysipelotrichaceae bacterium]